MAKYILSDIYGTKNTNEFPPLVGLATLAVFRFKISKKFRTNQHKPVDTFLRALRNRDLWRISIIFKKLFGNAFIIKKSCIFATLKFENLKREA